MSTTPYSERDDGSDDARLFTFCDARVLAACGVAAMVITVLTLVAVDVGEAAFALLRERGSDLPLLPAPAGVTLRGLRAWFADALR